ncbi:hypothetical protein OIE13_09730 [Streptosporangium sp. NBC_01810]|uniref:hypothetical protein n=1 Tax=Streptosporangium sp. NBC_01810 TaxID=2975951 RepID=UPI002DDAC954|nr:hypothetical protein [Streptosporangium sp. NBC_01810]WSA28116.1 hypothetical protein OIE13_09730 [Streptosporangium sp. NBC_01810]
MDRGRSPRHPDRPVDHHPVPADHHPDRPVDHHPVPVDHHPVPADGPASPGR